MLSSFLLDNHDLNRLLAGWILVGVLASLTAIFHFMYPVVAVSLAIPFGLLLIASWKYFKLFLKQSLKIRLQMIAFTFIWIVHGLGILMPETGFDALWYHLPIAKIFANQAGVIFVPDIYQSLNPFFTESIFWLGYLLAGDLGTKLVAYGLGLSFIFLAYRLSRMVMSKDWSWWTVISISLIQVVAWQSSSFYIDLGRAMWELGFLVLVLEQAQQGASFRKNGFWIMAGLLAGASLASKTFAVILMPVFMGIGYYLSQKKSEFGQFGVGLFSVVGVIYGWIWWQAGNPLLAVGIHIDKLSEIGGQDNVFEYLWQQFSTLPHSFWFLFFEARDYVSPLLLIFFPILIWQLVNNFQERRVRVLVSWVVFQYLVWWFVPPVSTRYALSGFVVWLILTFWSVENLLVKNRHWKTALILSVVVVNGFLLGPRLLVLYRSIPYLVGRESKNQYLERFYDGNIDQHLKSWYGI